ncbi:MAG: hypothetical protein AAGA53_03225 [Pseudomonadota bacterium]
MGKFMLNFAKDDVEPFQQQPAPSKIQFVTVENGASKEGPFQKGLCYASYYTMTFSAFCVFAPGQVAHAANVVTAALPM